MLFSQVVFWEKLSGRVLDLNVVKRHCLLLAFLLVTILYHYIILASYCKSGMFCRKNLPIFANRVTIRKAL